MSKVYRCMLFTSCLLAAPVSAASTWHVEAGVGVIALEQPWLNTAAVSSLVPTVLASYDRWRLGFDDGNVVSYGLALPYQAELRLGAGVRDDGYAADTLLGFRASNSRVFQGYQTPDPEATLSLRLEHPWFILQWQHQVNELANASVAKAAVVVPLWQNDQPFLLRATVGPVWQNQHYLQRLYGITNAQQDLSVGRTVYTPKASWHWEAALQASYALDPQWRLQAQWSYRQLTTAVTDSPLVDKHRDGLAQLALMLMYRF